MTFDGCALCVPVGVLCVCVCVWQQVAELQEELVEAREVGKGRLEEIQRLSAQLAEVKKELDVQRLSQQVVQESAVQDSVVYKTVQRQFTIAAHEADQLQGFLEEAKGTLMAARQHHFTQLEEIR